jgi:glycosyltransferase involved in cell wall biosynthesis
MSRKRSQLRSFDSLPGVKADGRSPPLRICVVTSEILGPVKNGGIGTATSALITHLAGSGHDVTILYTLVQRGVPECAEASWAHWVEQNARIGAKLIHIPHEGDYGNWLTKSWLVKKHLETQDYHAVYFNEHHGSGYYAMAAKRAGLNPFARQVHCVITHGSIEWVFNINDQRITRTSDLQMIGLERRCVEWADVVIGPSQYLLREYESYGWALPRQSYVQPYAFQPGEIVQTTAPGAVDELVFFGRLETRKGLWLFCDALDRMGDALRGRKVTFLGRPTDVGGVPSPIHIMSRAETWACKVELLLNCSQEQALGYLKQGGRAAVMPSVADNSPCVVYECIQQAIPFVTTSGSGADELIHQDCWPQVMCEPDAASLAERLLGVLGKGASCAKPRFRAEDNLAKWKAWGDLLSDTKARAAVLAAAAPRKPARTAAAGLSTFLFIDDRSIPLGRTLDALQRQMESFSTIGQFALVTSRLEPLRSLIEGALQARADQLDCKFSVVTPSTLSRYLKAAAKKGSTLFVSDACNEFLPPFVDAARRILNGKLADAVSCVLASRRDEQERPVITELPAGDLPAAGGIGMPVTSPAWAVSGEALDGHLSPADFHDAVSDETTPSQDIGLLLFHRLQIAGKPIRLVPDVGAIRTASHPQPQHRRHWYRSSALHAQAMGVSPSVNKGSLSWLAASSFSERAQAQVNRPKARLQLPEWNPAADIVQSGSEVLQLARLAAAHGRADQAVQLAAADGAAREAAGLIELAAQSMRARPSINLQLLLAGKLSAESASPAMLALRHAAYNLLISVNRQDIVLSCSDDALRMASLTFFDLAVEGHQTLGLACRAKDHGEYGLSVTVIDQGSGTLVAEISRTARNGTELVIDVPLRGVFGLFCVSVEMTPAARGSAGLVLSRLRID